MFANLITGGAFLAIAMFVFMMSEMIRNARLRARAIADLDIGKAQSESSSKRHAPSGFRRAMAGVIPQFGSEVEKIEKDLKRAGYYRPWALIDYLSSRNSLIVMVLIGFFHSGRIGSSRIETRSDTARSWSHHGNAGLRSATSHAGFPGKISRGSNSARLTRCVGHRPYVSFGRLVFERFVRPSFH